jgi:glycerol-3-phosphate acyltransferase PlsY
MLNLSIYIIIIFLASAPFEQFFPWLFKKLSEINAKLEKPSSPAYCSNAIFIFFFIQSANFLKGLLLPLLAYYYFENDYLLLLAVIFILICHNWSFFNKFKNRGNFFMLVWGIYTYLYPPLFFIYPLAYFLLTLLTNSLLIGYLTSLVSMLFFIWLFRLESFYIALNVPLILIVIFANKNKIIYYLENNFQTILQSFQSRK